METSVKTPYEEPQPVILLVQVAAKPQRRQQAKDALLADVQGARTEAGNYKMELYTTDEQPDHFYLFERWQSQSALEDHFKQPYTRGAFELQKGDLTAPIVMNYLEDLWPLSTGMQQEVHCPLTTLIVPFETKPGASEAFDSQFKAFVPLVRNETGNVEFHFHRVIESENRFVLYERWETPQDLDAHTSQPTTAALLEKISPLLTRPVADFVLAARDIS
jgi:quinol monooxygenase YgiN